MLALGHARLRAGRLHRRVDHFLMTTGGNLLLCHQHFLADRAMLALGQARLCTGRFHRLVNHFLMATGGNLLLCHQHFLADRAMLSFGQARLCTGRLHRRVNDHLVPLGGDCFLLCSCGLAAVRILERSVAAGADIIFMVTGFCMGRFLGLHLFRGVSQRRNGNLIQCGGYRSLRIGEELPAGAAFPVFPIAHFLTGCLLLRNRDDTVRLLRRFLPDCKNILALRAVFARCQTGAGTGGLHCRLDNNCMLGAVPGQRLEGQVDTGSIGLHKCVHLRARIAIHGNVHLSGVICVKRMSIIVIIQGIELDVGVREPHFGQLVAAFKEIGTNIAAFHCRFCQIGALAEHTVAAAFPVEALVQLYRAGNSDLGQSAAAHKDGVARYDHPISELYLVQKITIGKTIVPKNKRCIRRSGFLCTENDLLHARTPKGIFPNFRNICPNANLFYSTAVPMPWGIAGVAVIRHCTAAGNFQHAILHQGPSQITSAAPRCDALILHLEVKRRIQKCAVVACIIVNMHPFPLCLCSTVVHGFQNRAIIKGTYFNTRYTIWNCNLGQLGTILECSGLNACYALRDFHFTQSAAGKRIAANAAHGAGNADLRQRRTPRKSTVSNAAHGIGNADLRQRRTPRKNTVSNAAHSTGNADLRQRRTPIKSTVSNAAHSTGNADLRQRRTPIKSTVADTRHAIRYRDIRHAIAAGKRIISYILNTRAENHLFYLVGIAIPGRRIISTGRRIVIIGNSSGSGDRQHFVVVDRPCQIIPTLSGKNTGAVDRHVAPKACIPGCNMLPAGIRSAIVNIRQLLAGIKDTISNSCHTLGNRNTFHGLAGRKAILIQFRHTARNENAGHICAFLKCVFADGGYAFRNSNLPDLRAPAIPRCVPRGIGSHLSGSRNRQRSVVA